MIKIGDYEKIMSDRNLFNQVVYTPLSDALRLLEERQKDPVLMAKVEELLKGDIPEILRKRKCGVIARHIATPNHESRLFININKEVGLLPVFFEYYDDKFTSNNKFKHSLGNLHIQEKIIDKPSDIKKIKIVDFNAYDGKKLKEVFTLWDESLVDFHKKLFLCHGYNLDDFYSCDVSEWLKKNGEKAVDFYTKFLALFVCHGILFENFLISKDDEGNFTKSLVLPTIEKIMNILEVKPLIVPLEPLDLEAETFWFHHLNRVNKVIPNI